MKNLFLIRHAKSSWEEPLLADHDRPLNSRGLRDIVTQSIALEKYLSAQKITIDKIYSSSALRSHQFAEQISQRSNTSLSTEPELYTFNLRILAHFVANIPDQHSSAMIVAHNPAIHYLFNQLCNYQISKFPTSAIAHIQLKAQHWAEIEHLVGKLLWLKTPKGKIDYV